MSPSSITLNWELGMFGLPVRLRNGNVGLPIDKKPTDRSRFIEVGTAMRGGYVTFEQYQADVIGFEERKELLLDIALFFRLGHTDFEQGFLYSDWDLCA
jgi:hypothetical protein